MIDPDSLQIRKSNLPDHIHIKQVPPFDMEMYNLEDDKQYDKYIKDIEKECRKSDEYKRFIKYLRENLDMNKCAFLKDVSNQETFDIKIEIHHYPFTLRDICEIVYRKRCFYNESVLVMMTAKEVMILHYKLIVGLIPLSETLHELAHSGSIFIPVDHVLGRYQLFVDLYKPFCDPEQLETLERIEKYSIEQSQILNTTIIEQNYIHYQIEDNQYKLPQFNTITDAMVQQIEAIKSNNYMLPNVIQYQQPLLSVNQQQNKKEIVCPIEFDESLIKRAG